MLTRALTYLEPGKTATLGGDGGAGRACAAAASTATPDSCSSSILRSPPPSSGSRSAATSNSCTPDGGTVAPGKVTFEMTSVAKQRFAFGVMQLPPGVERPPPLHFAPFLSGKQLLTTQTFRDLFRSEVIRGHEGLGVKDIALLFTDLKGSTALYDRIGDLNAFALVQQHFDRLQDVTVRHNGAIIKTIGDAVMAAFLEPGRRGAGARSTCAARSPPSTQRQPDKALILKIGVHKGAAIAVTLNDRLDYFGQTVNIAARVQNLADADEIFVSQDVYDATGVRDELAAFPVEPQTAQLRGVQQELPVFRVGARRLTERKPLKLLGHDAKTSWLSPAVSSVENLESPAAAPPDIRPLFQYAERTRLEPSAGGGARKRLLAEPLAVGRVAEDEVEGRDRAGGAEVGRVAAQDAGDAVQAERLHVLADEAAALDACLDEHRRRRAARDRLDAERAGAGEEVEHARALARQVVAVDEDVEERLAQPVARRTDVVRARCGERPAPKSSADDAHADFVSAARLPCDARASSAAGFGSGSRSRSGASKSAPAARRELLAELVAQHAAAHLLDFAGLQVAELERAVGDADQPVHAEPEMLEHALHLAVLAFAQADRQPDVGALDAVELRLDRAIDHAVDGDATAELVELRLVVVAVRAHPVAPEPAGRRAAPARARGRRHW